MDLQVCCRSFAIRARQSVWFKRQRVMQLPVRESDRVCLATPRAHEVSQRMASGYLCNNRASVFMRIEGIIEQQGSAQKAFFFILKTIKSQTEIISLIDGMLGHNINLAAPDETGLTVMHVVTAKNFIRVARLLLDLGALTTRRDSDGCLPVEYAIRDRNDDMAALLMRNMRKALVREMFSPCVNHMEALNTRLPTLSLYKLISQQPKMKATAKAVLDSMLEPTNIPHQCVFHYEALEADSRGRPPEHPMFDITSQTAFHKAVQSKELRSHGVVRKLLHRKWSLYGCRSSRSSFLLHFIYVVLLVGSLMLAATNRSDKYRQPPSNRSSKYGDPRNYNHSRDYIRAILELPLVLLTIMILVRRFKEVRRVGSQMFVRDPYNWLQLLSCLLLFVFLALRFSNSDWQWTIAAALHITSWLLLLKPLSVMRVFGVYFNIVKQMLLYDVPKFALTFIIFLLAFAGAIYFILVGTALPGKGETGTALDAIDELSSLFVIILTYVRVLVEAGSPFNYIGKTLPWSVILLHMLFLFMTLVVMLTLLVAQLSDSYSKRLHDAQFTVESNWSSAVCMFESFLGNQGLRRDCYIKYERVSHPERDLVGFVPPTNDEEERLERRWKKAIERQLGRQEYLLMKIEAQLRSLIAENQQSPSPEMMARQSSH